MVHTIARYFNTPERMTDLFIKITHQMITNAKAYVFATPLPGAPASAAEFKEALEFNPSAMTSAGRNLWGKDVPVLIARLEDVLKLNEAFQEDYRLTKESLGATPTAKQFNFDDAAIFGRMDLYCRRVIKLIDTFATTSQFEQLSSHNLEGLEPIIAKFNVLLEDLKKKRHDLLSYADSAFDRDYVEFNVRVGELELELQKFINASFSSITSIDAALGLLEKVRVTSCGSLLRF